MIYNILLLLGANVLIPLAPIRPQFFLAYNIYDFTQIQQSAYHDMNISRIYDPAQFKKSFREALKTLHPDHGGNQQKFSKVKNLKSIMEYKINYYDLLNVTDIDMAYNQPLEKIASIKQLSYFFEAGVFYIIALLYTLSFTIDDNLRPSRKVIIPLLLATMLYQFYIHYNPQTMTIIDIISPQIPLFIQKSLLKRMFCIFSAIIRTYYLRRRTQEKRIFSELSKEQTSFEPYQKELDLLLKIYKDKEQKRKIQQGSFLYKLKKWISKGFTFFIFGMMIWGMIAPSTPQQTEF